MQLVRRGLAEHLTANRHEPEIRPGRHIPRRCSVSFLMNDCESALGLRIRRIQIPSGDIAFIDEGEGPPVLLLHGAPATSLGFVRVIRELRKHHRVIAPDLPGFGRSRAAESFERSLSAYATSIEEIVHALELERLVLLGFDSGGCTGLAAAARMAGKIEGLVIADSVPIPLTGRAWFVRMVLRYVVSSRLARWLNRKLNLLPWLVATVDPLRRPLSAHERAAITGAYDSAEKRDRVIDMFSAMGRDDGFMRRTAAEVTDRLADKPVLLLFGQLDPVRLAGGASRFSKMFHRTTLRIIRGEKHFPILAAGEQVAAEIEDWLRATKAARARPGLPVRTALGSGAEAPRGADEAISRT